MSGALETVSIPKPGTLGLNLEANFTPTDPQYCIELQNSVFDRAGRIAARPGWSLITQSGNHSEDTVSIGIYFENEDLEGDEEVISAANSKIYSGSFVLTDRTGALTPTGDDWQWINFNKLIIGVQAGETPIFWNGLGASFANITAASGALPTGNCGTAAFGRLWIVDADNTTIKYCATLDETHWLTGAGSFDTKEHWPDGYDEAMAITEFQDKLVVLGRRSLLIYDGMDDPDTTLELVDAIRVPGCIARDSVAHIGHDVVYMAPDGLRSLQRAIEFSNLPQEHLTRRVAEDIKQQIGTSTSPANIKGAYCPFFDAYIVRIENSYWYFNIRPEDGVIFRASKWTTGIAFKAIATGFNQAFVYLGVNDGVGLFAFDTTSTTLAQVYQDNGSSYRFTYKGSWLDTQGNRVLLPKYAIATFDTLADYSVTMQWAFDYSTTYDSSSIEMTPGSGSMWGEAEWSGDVAGDPLGEWSGGSSNVQRIRFPLGNFGSLLNVGFSVTIDGDPIALQRLDIFAIKGRLAA